MLHRSEIYYNAWKKRQDDGRSPLGVTDAPTSFKPCIVIRSFCLVNSGLFVGSETESGWFIINELE